MSSNITSETVTVNFIEYIQDTLIMRFAYTDSLNTLINFTGWEIDLEVRRKSTDILPSLKKSTSSGTISTNGSTYNIEIIITDIDTETLGKGTFPYFIKTKDTNGYINTLIVGTITLMVR